MIITTIQPHLHPTPRLSRIPPQPQHNSDYISGGNADVMSFDPRRSPHDGGAADETPDSSCDVALNDIPLYRTHSSRQAAGAPSQRPRNVLEAQVQDGDTLQAIAIRYRCSVGAMQFASILIVDKKNSPIAASTGGRHQAAQQNRT